MSDFNELKRNNPSKDRVEAVYQVVEEKPINVKSPNLFSLLMATIRRDKKYLESVNERKILPSFSYSFLTLIITVSLAVILVICYFSMDLVRFLPLIMIFCSIAIPIDILVFYYELNQERSINLFSLFVTVAFGFVFYLIIALIKRALLNTLSFYVNVDLYIMPLMFTIFVFAATFMLANIFKATTLSECFMIATTLTMTYYAVGTLTGIFESLFINVPNEIKDYDVATAILNEDRYLSQSITNVFSDWFYKYVYTPVMYSAWAVVIGAVVSMSSKLRNNKGNVPKSIYLLLLLVILFNYISLVNTSIRLFDVILKFMAFIGSAFLTVKFINNYISE